MINGCWGRADIFSGKTPPFQQTNWIGGMGWGRGGKQKRIIRRRKGLVRATRGQERIAGSEMHGVHT